jgi:hypothetical protein
MRRTKDEWLFVFRQQEKSGLSIAQFCRENDIPAGRFYSARSRYRSSSKPEKVKAAGTAADTEMPETCFVPVSVVEDAKIVEEVYSETRASFTFSECRSCRSSAQEEENLEMICNGLHFILPARHSEQNLLRLLKACSRL